MNDKVVAIVVTFNRKNFLIQCLKALKLQTHPLSAIIIIDNASTDGTQDSLRDNGLLEDGFCECFREEENTGGAGGFNAGVNLALDSNADWFWLMDDDVAPEKNCLEELLRHKDVSECIHPRKTLVNGKDYSWEHQIDIFTGQRTVLENKSFQNGKNIVFTNVACFEGMLVSRRVVEKIGPPDKKYFIAEDDTLFGIKASVHTNVSYVYHAVIRKLIPLGVTTAWKSFYIVRNQFYLHRDACDYLGLRPSFSAQAIFLFSRLLELIVMIKKGKSFIIPATKGFFEGISYMQSGRNPK